MVRPVLPLDTVAAALLSREGDSALRAALAALRDVGVDARLYVVDGERFRSPDGGEIAGESEQARSLHAGERAGDLVPLRERGRTVGALALRGERLDEDVRSGVAGLFALALSRERSTLVDDARERESLALQLATTARLASIGRLAPGIVHEINNPLFAILGLVELLLGDAEPGSRAEARLRLIQQTGLEIKEIVRALLDFARQRPEEPRLVSLNEVVARTVDLVRRASLAKGVEIVEHYGDEPTPVLARAGELEQVVVSLVANAEEALGERGTVAVDVAREGELAVARVSDDGPGIAPENVERVFQPFFTTRRGASGIGLTVGRTIAELHGGELTVRSTPGAGTSFELRLPLAASSAAE